MAIVDVEQGSVEWLQMRVGCATASRMADLMSKGKGGQESAARKKYKTEIICEMLTGRATDHYVTPAMEWGLDNEVFARNAYEVETENVVLAGGFAIHERVARFGASPDGLVGEEGCVEFKCPTTATHIEYINAGIVPPEYHWQMLAEMACADRQWCDFVSYDPRLPKKFQLFIRRFPRDDERIAEMEKAVEAFLWECVEQVKKMEKTKFVLLKADDIQERLQESLNDA